MTCAVFLSSTWPSLALSLCVLPFFFHFFLMFAVLSLNFHIFLLLCGVSTNHTSLIMLLLCFDMHSFFLPVYSWVLFEHPSLVACFFLFDLLFLKFCLYRFYLCVVSITPFPMSSLCKECMTWHDFPLKTQCSCLNDGWNDPVTVQGQLCKLWHYNLLHKLSSSNRWEEKIIW